MLIRSLVRPLVPLVLCLCGLAGAGRADDAPSAGFQAFQGLPPANIASAASLNQALAVLDRAPDTIVAEIGNRTVTWSDVADSIRKLPRVMAGLPFQQLFQAALVQEMQIKALAVRAESMGLDKNPFVQRHMTRAADTALADELLRRSLAPNMSDKGLRPIYDGVIAGKPGPEEVDARIIAVDERERAAALIQQLKDGATFADLAQGFSKDGSASAGGDLGFARLDMLAPELGAVIFALGVGETASFPVKSGNLWYVIRVESRRQTVAPSFDDVRMALEQDVMHAGIPELKNQALKDAPVKYYGLAGKQEYKK